ncbi:MAG: hypothetical protein WBA10_05125 [Elainellaceae cyanobacterium]
MKSYIFRVFTGDSSVMRSPIKTFTTNKLTKPSYIKTRWAK